MANTLFSAFGELNKFLTVCPYCGDLFYLSEARPYLMGKKPKSVIEKLRAEERRLDGLEEQLDALETHFRERAAKAGLRATKRLLKRIDPVFSGSGYDPQDVKVIFHPITYVVFHGLANDKLSKVMLLAHPAKDRTTENVHNSIDHAIQKGNIEFRTLHVDDSGQILSK